MELTSSHGRTGAGANSAVKDIYAPPRAPVADVELAAPSEGSFLLGFAAGFFGGCIALLLSRMAKPATKNGIYVGFLVAVAFGVIRGLAAK